jgi:molybdopterin-dependent oxidoreductase alpha subunit
MVSSPDAPGNPSELDGGPTTTVTGPQRWATGAPAIASSITRSVGAMGARRAAIALTVINQPSGFDCPGCAWPEPPPGQRHRVEFCESGAKAVAEEGTKKRVTRALFATHSVASLRQKSDFWMGQQGRLTEPMIKREQADHYEPISWDEAFQVVGTELRSLSDPNEAVFYTSGRTGNEAAFVYQLLARCFGTNNLPDCSNMCHEPTSFALEEAIGIGKGSVRLEDFELADLIVIAGQNPGSNHPRMLTTLEAAKKAGAKILAINPLPEAGLLRFKNPQRLRGVLGQGTTLADLHLPIRLGGDHALFQLFARWMVLRDSVDAGTIDRSFIASHTVGFEVLDAHLRALNEDLLVGETGLGRDELAAAFEMVVSAKRMIICWAMGITQHVDAMLTIREMANVAFLGGHIGRPGAGLSPIRGHSNVQGDRTMGIFERPKPELLHALQEHFGVSLPHLHGLDTIDAIRAFADGRAKVLIGLGGNFVRATPDTAVTEAAISNARLVVQISTKLNRSHLVGDAVSIILPALGRTDGDVTRFGAQFVTVEDSMGLVHTSKGVLDPPGVARSEVSIVCDIASAVFGPTHQIDWASMRCHNDLVRDHIQAVIPGFHAFNERVRVAGGFSLPHPPRDSRAFPTASGRAAFAVTNVRPTARAPGTLLLQTLRSHDQYNTTIYGHDDRYRGLSGDRHVIMVSERDLTALELVDGEVVDVVCELGGIERRASGYRLVTYPTPVGCAAGYYPELNVLLPLDHHGADAQTPAAKAIPVRLIRRSTS